MEENKNNNLGLANALNKFGVESKYVFRKTNVEVEVIDFNIVESGARNDGDWVTYIDQNGEEHIKEHLNIQLDFKASNSISKMFEKMLNPPTFKSTLPKLPSTKNCRIFEIVKELVIKHNYSVEDAIIKAEAIVNATQELGESSEEDIKE